MTKRILTISKPYVSYPYRRKLEILNADPRFEMGLICPEVWGNQAFEPQPESGRKLSVKSLPTYFSSKNHFHLYKNLYREIAAFAPDILNVEEEDYSFVTWQAFRIAKKIGAKPLFYAWQNIDKSYPPPFCNIERYIYRHAVAAMGGSSTAGDILRKKGYTGPFYKIPQIGIDTEIFRIAGNVEQEKRSFKQQLQLNPDQFTVFYGGRIVEEKGIQTLIGAAKSLKRDDLHVLIVGSGPYIPQLKQLAKDLPAANITFVPYVTTSEMPRYIQAADALCLGSLTRPNWMEQGPVRIVTESMASSTVAVVSSSGELPDVVGEDGIVFPEGDESALAGQLERLLSDKELVADLRIRGVKKVDNHYSASAVAYKCGEVFASL